MLDYINESRKSRYSLERNIYSQNECDVMFPRVVLTVCFAVWRYQPEHSIVAYEMANTQDEPEIVESYNVDMLPQPEDRFTIKTLLNPSNTEPSPQSGSAVNICTTVLGETHTKPRDNWMKVPEWFTWLLIQNIIWSPSFPPGVLVIVFSIVAVQGGLQTWSVSVLSIIMVVCLILTIIVWRQPQSKAKLAFKVECSFTNVFSHNVSVSRTNNIFKMC